MAGKKKDVVGDPTNGGEESILASAPYTVRVQITGSAKFLFHRWNCESIEAKAAAAKNSAAKRTDDTASYVYRDDDGNLCIPGEYLRQAIIAAAKYRQDPRSPRKSMMDITKAGIVSLTDLASLGVQDWDFLDKRRVVVQRAGINRTRPAMNAGWSAEFDLMVGLPEYFTPALVNDLLVDAGRLIGIGDFRPTFGRFNVTHFEVLTK